MLACPETNVTCGVVILSVTDRLNVLIFDSFLPPKGQQSKRKLQRTRRVVTLSCWKELEPQSASLSVYLASHQLEDTTFSDLLLPVSSSCELDGIKDYRCQLPFFHFISFISLVCCGRKKLHFLSYIRKMSAPTDRGFFSHTDLLRRKMH
jgi:hypothetical protein